MRRWRLTTWLVVLWTLLWIVGITIWAWEDVVFAMDPAFSINGHIKLLLDALGTTQPLVGAWFVGFVVLSLVWLMADRSR